MRALRSVVVLNSFCHVQGGASRVAIDEAVGLAAQGIEVIFVGAVGPISDELQAAGVRVICLGQSELSEAAGKPEVALQGLWNSAAYGAMAQVLSGLEPRNTVVHLHGFTQGLSSSPVRRALQREFKVVSTLHDFFVACPNGGFFDYVAESTCHRPPLSLRCIATNCDKRAYSHKMYRVLRSSVQRLAGGLPGGVMHYIAPSTRAADVMRPHLPRNARIFGLRNPVEVPRAPPIDVARNTTIVAIGRLSPEKGIAVLAQAAQLARTTVRLVGDGALRGLAEASGVCTVTGWLSREGVLAELEAARCLVFPSVCYETFGLSVAEAAARGVPAIVSDATGAVERVDDNVTGWHTRAGDAADLAECLRRVLDDASVTKAGTAAYEKFWQAPPTRATHAEELLHIYEDILRGQGALAP